MLASDTRSSATAADSRVGHTVGGKFTLEARLGDGELGTMYSARTRDGARVALRAVPRRDLGASEARQLVEQMRAEATIADPHVVPVLALGEDEELDIVYVATPQLGNRTLERLIRDEAPFEPSTAIRIALQICEGLDAAHRQGVFHLDLRPANVFIESSDPPIVKLADFGFSRHLSRSAQARLTVTGTCIGAPEFMSPEQLRRPQDADARSDVWSAGVILYQMLTGRAPHATTHSEAELLVAVCTTDAPHVQDAAPWVDPDVALVVHWALCRDPDDRLPSTAIFARALGEQLERKELAEATLRSASERTRSTKADRTQLDRITVLRETLLSEQDEAPEEKDELLGHVIDGRFRVLRMLGRGGMGAVYEVEARDGSRAAAKVMTSEAEGDSQLTKRFLREARAALSIDSPHVCRVIEAGADKAREQPFIIMELMRGIDVSTLVQRQGPLAPAAALRVWIDAARGVGAAHDKGIIHRDIKPANIFLEVDTRSGAVTPKVCDFGIAKRTLTDSDEHTHELTQTGGLMGSPMYMSPEQARSARSVDARSDVWSLAATLYEMLTGRVLWEGNSSLGDILVAIITEPVRPLHRVAPWIDGKLADLIEKGLEKDPEKRWQSVAEMVDAASPLLPPVDESPDGAPRSVTLTDLVGIDPELRLLTRTIGASDPPPPGSETTQLPPTMVDGGDPRSAEASTLLEATSDRTVLEPGRRRFGLVGFIAAVLAIGAIAVVTAVNRPTPVDPSAAAMPADQPTVARLDISPATADVTVGGKAARVVDGQVEISGMPGEVFEVLVSHAGAKRSARIVIVQDGTLSPASIELETSMAVVPSIAPPVESAQHEPPSQKPPTRAKRSPSSGPVKRKPAPAPRAAATTPKPDPKPAPTPKPAEEKPRVNPRDRWE